MKTRSSSRLLTGICCAFFGLWLFCALSARGQAPGLDHLDRLDAGRTKAENALWIENALCVVALVLLWREPARRSERGIFLAACAVLLMGTIYRVDSYLVAFHTTPGWRYFPSVPEIMVTIGIGSLEILLYIMFVKFLPVLSNPALPAKGRA